MKSKIIIANSLILFIIAISFFGVFAYSQSDEVETNSLFEDEALENVVRERLEKPEGNLTIDDLKKVTTIIARGKNISSLKGIEHCTRLRTLDLRNNLIEDISHLRSLDRLKLLDLSDNNISDISPLTDIKSIETLYLGDNNVEDISSLAKTPRITHLNLSENSINDISSLSALKNLQVIYLNDNRIRDIESLKELYELTLMNISSNNISEIYDLSGLRDLIQLDISNNNISDIEPLRKLVKLIDLNLNSNPIQSTSPLTNMSKLRVLHLDKTLIWDVTILRRIFNKGGFQDKNPSSPYDITIIDNYLDMRPGETDRNIVENLINNGVRVRWEKGNFTTNNYTGEPIKINKVEVQKNSDANLINNLKAQGGERLVDLDWKSNSIKISWEKFPKALHYIIYRHSKDGKKELLESIPVNEFESKTEFIDKNPKDDDNYYSVSVISVLENEIAESKPIKAPSPNEGYTFVIQRSKEKDANYNDVGTTNKTDYIDKGLSYDETYYYRIKALKEETASRPSLSNTVDARTNPLDIKTLDMSASPYKAEYNSIHVLVNVFNEDYLPLKWLDENHFKVSEEGASLNVRSVEPINNMQQSNAIMMDYSSTMPDRNKDYMTEQTKMMISRKSKNDKYKIIKFGSDINNTNQFELDYMKLENSLSQNFNTKTGKNHLYDALYRGVAEVSKTYQMNRRYLTLFSNGVDTSSSRRLDEVMLYAKLKYTPIYTIAYDDSDKDVLKSLSRETGGIMFDSDKVNNLSEKMSYMFKYTYLLEVQVPSLKNKHRLNISCEYDNHKASTETDVYIKDRDILPEYPVNIVNIDKSADGMRKPINLKAEPQSQTEIKISWELSASAKIKWRSMPYADSYIVYHSTTKDGKYEKITRNKLTNTEFTHENVNQDNNYYKVSVVNKFGEFAVSEPKLYQSTGSKPKDVEFEIHYSKKDDSLLRDGNDDNNNKIPKKDYEHTHNLGADILCYYKVCLEDPTTGEKIFGDEIVSAKTPPASREGIEITRPAVIESGDGKIKLFVLAHNKYGAVITDLKKDEVQIIEDGENLEIISFESDQSDIPITGVLTMDYSGSMYKENPDRINSDGDHIWKNCPNIDIEHDYYLYLDSPNIKNMENDISNFIKQKNNNDELAILKFSNKYDNEFDITKITKNQDTLFNQIDQKYDWFAGGTALYDSLYKAVLEVSKKPASTRRFVIGFTDGKNSSNEKDEEDVINLAKEKNIPIFTVGFGENVASDVLEDIAYKTGGCYTKGGKNENIYDKISELIRRIYIIEIAVPVVKDIHNLDIKFKDERGQFKILNYEIYTR